ncbi:hypothetical protein HOY80DRAFT_965899 [Tuber brumale]|nr:hypothetical protein HOY80DRAFT_965899 [Tuber brumale]
MMHVRGTEAIGVRASRRMVCAHAMNSSATIGQFCFHLFPFFFFSLSSLSFFLPLLISFFHHHHHNPARQKFRTTLRSEGFTFGVYTLLLIFFVSF